FLVIPPYLCHALPPGWGSWQTGWGSWLGPLNLHRHAGDPSPESDEDEEDAEPYAEAKPLGQTHGQGAALHAFQFGGCFSHSPSRITVLPSPCRVHTIPRNDSVQSPAIWMWPGQWTKQQEEYGQG